MGVTFVTMLRCDVKLESADFVQEMRQTLQKAQEITQVISEACDKCAKDGKSKIENNSVKCKTKC